ILATTEAHKLPATIISRCQRFDFKKVQFNDLLQRLKWIAAQEEVSVEENVLKVIAKQSGGCVRDAESLLEQIFSLGEKNITLEKAELILPKMDNESFYKFFEMIIKNRSGQAIDLVNGLLRQGMDLNQFIDGFLLFCRQVLIYKLNNRLEELSLEFPDDIVEKLVNLSSEISTQNVSLLIKKILRARKSFDDNFISQLPLEMVIFEMTDSGGGSEVNLENKTKREVYEQPKKEEKGSFEQKSSSEGFEKKKQEIIVEKSKNEQKKDLSKDKNRENSGKDHQDLKKINKSDNIDLDELLKRWARILEKVKLEDYGVYMSLRMGKPISCQSDKIIIGFLFELQRQRLEKVDSQNVLRQALKQTMGFDPAVETAIEPSLSISDFSNGNGSSTVKKDLNETAENVAKEFDGELM
ncbi:MAG TPA: hypothetical protein VKP03_02285, partial [Patescibacteria group bacterium]|nr:hypothetical protein [Patescibacteria group bacterium]